MCSTCSSIHNGTSNLVTNIPASRLCLCCKIDVLGTEPLKAHIRTDGQSKSMQLHKFETGRNLPLVLKIVAPTAHVV